MNLKALYRDIERCISERAEFILKEERSVIERELELFAELAGSNSTSFPELQIRLASLAEPLFSDLDHCIQRTHEVAGIGSLPSCQSSSRIIEAFFDVGLLSASGTADNLIVGRGHIASTFYALRYMRGAFPLCFLFSAYDAVSPVVSREWGFSNSMRHSLGEGLSMSVGLALSRSCADQNQHLYCFAGDGELQEGISYEAIRIAYEHDIKNFTLIIDENMMGITRLAKPLNYKFLDAYFDQVYILEDQREAIRDRLELCGEEGLRSAIVVRTKKLYHSYRRDQISNTSTCSELGTTLRNLREKHSNLLTLCPDLSIRFGLKGNIEHINTGLSEQSTVAMMMALPPEVPKVLLTDDKYLLNSLDCLESAFAQNRRIFVVAARKNSVWGGPLNTPNIFAGLEGAPCYELCSPLHLERIISAGIEKGENAFILFYDDDWEAVSAMEEEYQPVSNESLFLGRPSELLFISTESFASTVYQLSRHFDASHLRLLSKRSDLGKGITPDLSKFEKIVLYERNPARGGVGQYLRSATLRDIEVVSVENYDRPAGEKRQKILSGTDLQALVRKTKELLDV